MENKNGNVSTIFLVIAIILIVVMGALLYMQKTEADRQIAKLENNAGKLQETINDLQGKINTISNTINSNTSGDIDNSQSNSTVDNKDDKFSDKEIKDSIKNYLNIFKGAGSVEGRLEKMGLLEFGEFNNNQTTTDNYRKTDIKYSDFKSTVKNYVSEDWFNIINNNTKWEIIEFKEQDGLLYYYDSGWTGTEYEVESITLKGDYSDSRYIAKAYRINIDDSKEVENIEFEITNYNGKCVISYCD